MKKIILASIAAFGCTAMGSAFAATAQSGVYVGALAGWSFADSPSGNPQQSNASNVDNKNYTYGITLGYDYALNTNWLAGIETSYIDFGHNTYENDGGTPGSNPKLKNWGLQFMVTGTYLMNNGFNAFGKVGAINQRTDGVFGGDEQGVTKWIPAAAVGIGYMPIQNLNIALQYEHTFGTNWDDNNGVGANPDPMTQNVVTLGVSYKFAL